ncbi:urease accessory protein [Frankia sp. B2]|nr:MULTISPECIES: urease accessory UreF family protein [unclassified Frankia]ETA01613.1 urease accessory protein UreF [Frankia sp. CcI6]KDA43438.1 urease accessory protein UreF [Frankia sp. BMG5.23]KFB04299.1 urease accessory protein UreF [Frankia sp. Allo2]TFE32093.1 urease accessory protein [Frankia sp. B2]
MTIEGDTARDGGTEDVAGPTGRSGRRATLLVLADGRMPTGGHAHSGGVEAAVTDGSLANLSDLAAFLVGRLTTTGLVAAAFAAAACRAGTQPGPATRAPHADHVPTASVTPVTIVTPTTIATLDAELDARMPSPAQRDASRAQGRTLLRAGRAAWPVPPGPRAPHHPCALGMVAAGAGLRPSDAALVAAHTTVTGPATAATRLMGLDPLAVTAVLARLADEVEAIALAGAEASRRPPRLLPAVTGIRLDLLAERHRTTALRMFTS